MEKLLLVTGELAEKEVREAAQKLGASVLVLPVSVAQFMSPSIVIEKIRDLGIKYERIIFPGLTRFDVTKVEKAIGMPCFKGPQHASDLVEVIERRIKLSKIEAADSLMERKGLEDYKRAAEEAESRGEMFRIGSLKIGSGFPPRIIAEIVDAPLLSDKAALKRARYYLESGADIIDVGAIANENNQDELARIIRFLKSNIRAPVSIDSLDPEEINSGLRAGADLVLSLTSENMDNVEKTDAAYVVIPGKEGLADSIKKAEECGFKKIIADPILYPPFRTVESLSQYLGLKGRPVMMGVGNVVELMDADSIGINGLLAAMAVELEVSLLLTTENSEKTRNSVRELKRAVEMAFLAKSRGSLPKDLGFNLLLAKGKGKGAEFDLNVGCIVDVRETPQFKEDPSGHFSIFVDQDKREIIAAHFNGGYDYVFRGATAEAISKKIVEKGLVSRLEHAAYLGSELQKAEICLRLGRGYVQDEALPGL